MLSKKLKILFIVLVYLLFINNLLSKEDKNNCDTLLTEKNYINAMTEANTLLKKDPLNVNALFCRGRSYYNLGKYQKSVIDFKLVNQKSKDNVQRSISMLMLISSLKKDNKLDDAIKEINIAINNEDKKLFNRLLFNSLAEIYFERENYIESINAYKEGLKLSSNDNERAENYSYLARNFAKQGNYLNAIEFELKASLSFEKLSLLSDYADSNINLVIYHSKIGDFKAAENIALKLKNFIIENGSIYYQCKVLFTESYLFKMQGNLDLSRARELEAITLSDELGPNDLLTFFKSLGST
jgi:tetratricopeptide (TPR) repeat protein